MAKTITDDLSFQKIHSVKDLKDSFIDKLNEEPVWLGATAKSTLSHIRQIVIKLKALEVGNYVEADPIFTAHVAFGITSTNITNWDTAFGWGSHAGLYSLLDHTHSGMVTGSGSAGYLAKFSAGLSLADSVMYESSGNIGIGTITPTVKLHVAGDLKVISGDRELSYAGGALNIKSGAGGWANYLGFKGSADTLLGSFGALGSDDALSYFYVGAVFNTPSMVWLPNGNVGLGITTPAYNLDVVGEINAATRYRCGGTAPAADGTYDLSNGASITIKGGIVTGIVPTM
jgi:hypothetical protein